LLLRNTGNKLPVPPSDHKALWEHIKKNASNEELNRIIEITTDI
jgi:hypothetical protein